jgi:CHRD domain
MRTQRPIVLALGGVVLLSLLLATSGIVLAGGRPFTVEPLTGSAEAPIPGDPDGSGTATFTMNPGTGEVCYDYSVTGVEPLAAAHIHVAPPGVAGPVVIPLPPTRPDGGTGCVTADRDLLVAIIADPSAYYFNVHNSAFQGGALRGQLSRQP